jgi:uridine kinase
MKRILFLVIFCSSLYGAVPEQIVENIEYILNREQKIPIIAIGGCPGVGKSTFATLLLQELSKKNIRSIILSFDDFGKTQEEKKELRNELDIMRIRWSDLYSVLEEIWVGNKKIKIPKINQLTKERTEETLNLTEIDLILFEGMYMLSNTDEIRLQPFVDLGIYMETTTENICQWKWEREKKKTNPRTREEFEAHMVLIFEDFIRFVFPTKQNADWVVFANNQHELTVIK